MLSSIRLSEEIYCTQKGKSSMHPFLGHQNATSSFNADKQVFPFGFIGLEMCIFNISNVLVAMVQSNFIDDPCPWTMVSIIWMVLFGGGWVTTSQNPVKKIMRRVRRLVVVYLVSRVGYWRVYYWHFLFNTFFKDFYGTILCLTVLGDKGQTYHGSLNTRKLIINTKTGNKNLADGLCLRCLSTTTTIPSSSPQGWTY